MIIRMEVNKFGFSLITSKMQGFLLDFSHVSTEHSKIHTLIAERKSIQTE